MTAAIVVSPETRNIALAGLPTAARHGLHTCRKDTAADALEVTLPDGRQLIFQGAQPGPTAQMQVKDYRFAWRTVRSGDIGVAEAYLRGEWDTPDLTQFLYLFCVNRDMMESVLGNNVRPLAAGASPLAEPQHQSGRRARTSTPITTSATRSIRPGSIRR